MNDKANEQARRDLKVAAIVTCAAVISFFAVYWAVQIQDVIELLEMAYG